MVNYVTSKGVQNFTITIGSASTTGTATISAVGSGAYIVFGGENPSVAGTPSEDFAYLQLTNSTTITATRNTTGGTTIIKGSIVDGDTTNLIKSVQQGTISISSGTGTGTAAISSVTNANAATHWMGFQTPSASGVTNQIFSILSLSGTTVTGTVAVTGTASTVAYQIIEYQGTALTATAVQNISASSSSNVTSWTAAITSVTTTNSVSFYGGFSTADNTVETMATVMARGTLTNGTTFTVNVNTGVAAARIYNASIVEFISGVLKSSVQRGTTTLTAVTSNTSSITSVNTSNAGINFLGNTSTDTSFGYIDAMGATALTAATTLTTTKNLATSNITASWEVFEFSPLVAANNNAIWFGAIA